jgi:hypothetical protein
MPQAHCLSDVQSVLVSNVLRYQAMEESAAQLKALSHVTAAICRHMALPESVPELEGDSVHTSMQTAGAVCREQGKSFQASMHARALVG